MEASASDSVVAESATYSLRRMELALATARHYVRTFWWMLLGMPLAGLLVLIFLHDPLAKVLGFFMLLWPITIPARASLLTYRDWRKQSGPRKLLVTEDAVIIVPEGSKGTRVPFDWMRRVHRFGADYVLEGYRFRFVIVRADAFAPDDSRKIEELFSRRGLMPRS